MHSPDGRLNISVKYAHRAQLIPYQVNDRLLAKSYPDMLSLMNRDGTEFVIPNEQFYEGTNVFCCLVASS